VIMMDAEVRWHDEFGKLLAELPPGEADGDAPGPGSAGQVEGNQHGDH
jgi:hypothetical protein